ncbi:MAG: hypothetical protein JNM00_02165, partial [Flavobacteriales bacterium]|nr:hypothetical protein [Flavobacteriales bacterium]
ICCLLLLLLSSFAGAQSLDRQVLGSAGTFFGQPTLQIEFTLGETSVLTLSEGSYVLTQGFHQPLIPTTSCEGDLDNNGAINTSDLLVFLAAFGCTINCGPADLDGNGAVNVSDLLVFTALFGTTCE